MKKLILLFFASVSFCASSQNKSWILAPNYYKDINNINFSDPLPTFGPADSDPLTGYDGQPAEQAQNIQTDANGDIMFFIVDKYIYGRNGELIEVLRTDPNTIEYIYNSEILILPDNQDCNLYHLLFSAYNNYNGVVNPYYCKLKLSYNSEGKLNERSGYIREPENGCNNFMYPLEEFIPNYSSNQNNIVAPVFFSASKSSTGAYDIFVSTRRMIHQLKVDNGGINFIQSFDFTLTNTEGFGFGSLSNLQLYNISEMEVLRLSNDEFRVALALEISFPSPPPIPAPNWELSIYTFDISTSVGYITDTYRSCRYQGTNGYYTSQEASTFHVSGLEFSRNGNHLFVSHAPFETNGSTLDYWDISLPNSTYTLPTNFPLSTLEKFGHGQIEMVSNGDMFVASYNELGRITNTNSTPTFNGTGSISISNYGLTSPPPPYNYYEKYILQDQVDDMDYSVLAPAHYDAFVTEHSNPITTVWKPNTATTGYANNPLVYGLGNIAYIEKELRIKAGSKLYIQNMTLVFGKDARVVIENGTNGNQGGKLILQNSQLIADDRCNNFDKLWYGVEVWGNQNQSQGSINNSTQGVFIMEGASIIEDAEIGVLASKRKYTDIMSLVQNMNCETEAFYEDVITPNSYDDAYNGGIVQIKSGSELINNKTSVYFRKHSSPSGANNLSSFTKTTFSWDGVLKENALPNDHIKMDQVKGINIIGCTFNQETPELYSMTQRGYGINAYMSQFYVDKYCQQLIIGQPCSNITITEFNDLNYGVLAYYGTTPLSFSVNESEFNNCRYGIYSSRSESARITKNTFNILEENVQSAGCIMHFSDGYTIQENKFQELDNPLVAHGSGQSYGIIIHNSGVDDNEVYKNTFENLKVGGQSERLNASSIASNNGGTGLNWTCNEFYSDIYQADLGINGVIDYHQGHPITTSSTLAQANSARNTFSIAATTNTEHDIMVYNPTNTVYPAIQTISYVYLDDSYHIPNDADNSVSLTVAQSGGMNIAPSGNYCPTKIRTIGDIKPLVFKFKSDIDSLNNIIDNGDTESLITAISEDPNSPATRSLLMAVSPYLSDEVLLHYLNECTLNRYVKDVFIANSKLSSSVNEAMLSSSLPVGTKNDITLAQGNVSAREQLYFLINGTESEYTSAYNNYKSLLLLDTTELATFSSLKEELESIDDLRAKRDLYLIAVELQDEATASVLRGEIDTELEGDFFKIMDATIALQAYSSNEVGLSENQSIYDQLKGFDENSNWFFASSASKNILSCLDGIQEVPEFLPLVSPSSMMIGNQASTDDIGSGNRLLPLQVSIYPNPSNGNVYFDLPNEEEGTLVIQLVDITGKEVYTTQFDQTNGQMVDLSHLKKGTYIVKITLDESYSESQLLQLKD